MNFKIEDLSDIENDMVKKARKNYGNVFENANDLILLIWNFLPVTINSKAWIFILFLSQVQKFLCLALFSAIRKHDVQSHMMLRYALESAVLACYGLYNPSEEDFAYVDPKGILHQKDKFKEKAYKWFEEKYATHSKKIKDMKNGINEYFSHANIIPAQSNFDYLTSEMKILFFDKRDNLIIKQRLWWIANISFGLLDLFSKVIHDFPIVKLNNDFASKMRKLGAENDSIKQELMKNPRFSKNIKNIQND